MSQVNATGGAGNVGGIDLGACSGNINFMFAKLQMQLSSSAKESALGHIKDIEDSQKQQKEVADMLQRCRQLQSDANGGTGNCSWDKKASMLPADIAAYMDKNDLAYDKTGGDLAMNKDEWDVAIQSLQAHQEQLGTDIQTKMVYVQDFMGQYNSYLQGANSTIQSGLQTLTSVARGQ